MSPPICHAQVWITRPKNFGRRPRPSYGYNQPAGTPLPVLGGHRSSCRCGLCLARFLRRRLLPDQPATEHMIALLLVAHDSYQFIESSGNLLLLPRFHWARLLGKFSVT